MKKIVVLGAGITGLAAAWYLKKRYKEAIDLTVMEKSGRVGGWIRTVHAGSFLFEEGPRGFRPTGKGKATLELVNELGLTEELIGSAPTTRYIYEGGKLRPFNLWFLLRQGILGAALRDLLTPATHAEDETLYDFTKRRFNRRLAENLMDPLAKGVFGGDARQLSVRSCMPLLWEMEQQKGSLIRGFLAKKKERHPVSLYTLKEGMERLPKVLAEKLECPVLLSNPVESLKELDADVIISALPTSALAPLIHLKDPLEYATFSTVNCGWNRQILKKRGYGFLIPSRAKSGILGMTWDSEIFPTQNQGEQTRICVMVAGAQTQEELYTQALKGLKDYLGITEPPEGWSAHVAQGAIPHYTLHHHQRIAAFKKALPSHVYPLGNCFDGVGVNDCIFNAQRLVKSLSL